MRCYFCKKQFTKESLRIVTNFDENGRWCAMTFCPEHVSKADSLYNINLPPKKAPMKAYIDRQNKELITVGFYPTIAASLVKQLDLWYWSWVDEDRAIPDSWEEVEISESLLEEL